LVSIYDVKKGETYCPQNHLQYLAVAIKEGSI